MPFGFEGPHALADGRPRLSRIAAHIDQISAVCTKTTCHTQDLVQGQPRRMIDFGQNFNRVATVIFQARGLAKKLVQLAQVTRTALDAGSCYRLNRRQASLAVTRNDNARRHLRNSNMPGNPSRRHERRYRNWQDVERVVEADSFGQRCHDGPQRVFGQATGDKMNVLGGHGRYSYRNPPLIGIICPVMKSAAGEAKNTAAWATSSGVPQRPLSDCRAACSCQYSEACSAHAVRIQPGARQFTRTSGASDCARLRVNAITAPFTVANISPLSPAMPCAAWSQPMFRMTPWPRAFIRLPTARERTTVARTSTSHSAASFCSNGQLAAPPVRTSAPAILAQISIPVCHSQAAAAKVWHALASERSVDRKRASRPSR